jgi:hypothetical protein
MQIPAGWTHLVTEPVTEGGKPLVHKTTAFFVTEEFILQVTHQTRDMTTIQVREPYGQRGFHFQHTGDVIEWGAHRSPAEAFRFAEAYLAGGSDFRPAKPRRTSDRYSDAVEVAYAR